MRIALMVTTLVALCGQPACAQWGSPNSPLPPGSAASCSFAQLARRFHLRRTPAVTTRMDAARSLEAMLREFEAMLHAPINAVGPEGPGSDSEPHKRPPRQLTTPLDLRGDMGALQDLLTELSPELNALGTDSRHFRAMLVSTDERLTRLEAALRRIPKMGPRSIGIDQNPDTPP